MPEEIEAKVRVASPEAFRRRMEERGSPSGGTVLEVNRLYDDAAETLQRRDAALRVREDRDLETGAVRRARLTYKGPQVRSDLKRRAEHEVAVDSAEALVAILEAMGLSETFHFEKRRTTWREGECEVALDEVPHLGWFAEIEGPTEKAVRGLLGELGLADEPTIRQTYMAMLAEHLKALGRDPTRAVFEPGK